MEAFIYIYIYTHTPQGLHKMNSNGLCFLQLCTEFVTPFFNRGKFTMLLGHTKGSNMSISLIILLLGKETFRRFAQLVMLVADAGRIIC